MSPPVPPNSDNSIKVAKITAYSVVAVAILSGLFNFIQAVFINHSSRDSSSNTKLVLGPISTPQDGGTVGEFVDVSGSVSGLKAGEMIWTFNEPLSPKGGTYYPNTGPCAVQSGKWTCNDVAIGGTYKKGEQGTLGSYRIWAVVVGEQEASDIVRHLRCFPSGNLSPKVSGVKIVAACPNTYQSLPGSDIAAPQRITVLRNH